MWKQKPTDLAADSQEVKNRIQQRQNIFTKLDLIKTRVNQVAKAIHNVNNYSIAGS